MPITTTPPFLRDFQLEVPRGRVASTEHINKFGRSPNVDDAIATDIWDRANASNNQAIWTAPTTARTHQIDSTSSQDDGSPPGTGARTVRLYGLTAWNAAGETFEDITLNGTANVPTVNQYVIIYRMEVLTSGTSINVGDIRATADTDGTITAQIQAGEGQTLMAIYAVPSTQSAYMVNFYLSVQAVASGKEVLARLLANCNPDVQLTNYRTQHIMGVGGSGTTSYQHRYRPYKRFPGPVILKMQAQGVGGSDIDTSAGFDVFAVDN